MSLNPAVRTECLETLLNPAEMNSFTALSKLLGISKSALNRSLINSAVRTHGMAPRRRGNPEVVGVLAARPVAQAASTSGGIFNGFRLRSEQAKK